MSLVLTRNAALLHRWRHLKGVDPESGSQWEKQFLPKTARSLKLYGFYHNSPYSNWNNKAYFAFETPVLRDTIVSEVFKHRELSRFSELLKLCESSVLHQLSTPGPWTLFAPVNSAFDAIEGGWSKFLEHARQNPIGLASFLTKHAVRGKSKISDLSRRKSSSLSSLDGSKLAIKVNGSFENSDRSISIGRNAKVISYDRRAHNGYINLIDGILLPKKI
jgi:uncharacterized surface protein with fasciclin (FAS1) repeats